MKHTNISYLLFLLFLLAPNISKAEVKRDSLYLQMFGGINKSANENLPFSEFSQYPFSFDAFLGIGKEISPIWGWRSTLGINHNKSRNVEKCESNDTWGWNDVELFADITFDVTDAIQNSFISPKFNLKTFVGIGGLWTYGFPKEIPLSYTQAYSKNSKLNFGFRAGLNASWKLSSSTSLGVELSHTMVQDQFNGVVDYKLPLDRRTNLSIGITWMPNHKKRKKKMGPIVFSNRLKTIPDLPFIIPNKETNKNRRLEGKAFLDFPVNETVIYPSYRNNPNELRKIKESIDQVRFDKSVIINSVYLHGYASPESPYANNERLAKGRTFAMENYLKNEYNLEFVKFETKYTPEDWDNLRKFVSDSMSILNPEQSIYRDELLNIIDSNLNPDLKEDKLKQIGEGAPYQWIYQKIYPALRHTDYLITYTIKDYPIKEARRLIYTHPEALSLDEIYAVATSYQENSEGYFDALMIGAKQFPESDVANINASCACIKRRKLKDARMFAIKANETSDSKYLLGIIDAMEGKVNWHLENGKLIVDDTKK